MPAIIQIKLDVGITKFKASTIAEVEMTVEAGGRDILLAYQLSRTERATPDQAYRFAIPKPRFRRLWTIESLSWDLRQLQKKQGFGLRFLDLNSGMGRTGGIRPTGIELYKLIHSLNSFNRMRFSCI